MEKKSVQKLAYMDFVPRDSHNSMSVWYYTLSAISVPISEQETSFIPSDIISPVL